MSLVGKRASEESDSSRKRQRTSAVDEHEFFEMPGWVECPTTTHFLLKVRIAGSQEEVTYPIPTQPVFFLGSDKDCDIVVTGVNENHLVFAHDSDSNLHVKPLEGITTFGGAELPTSSFSELKAGAVLELKGDVIIAVRVEEDEANETAADADAAVDAEAAAELVPPAVNSAAAEEYELVPPGPLPIQPSASVAADRVTFTPGKAHWRRQAEPKRGILKSQNASAGASSSLQWKDNVEELYHVTPIPYPEDYYSYIYEAMQGLTGDPGVPLEVLLNATDEVDIAQAEGALQVEVGNGVSAPSWTESNSDATELKGDETSWPVEDDWGADGCDDGNAKMKPLACGEPLKEVETATTKEQLKGFATLDSATQVTSEDVSITGVFGYEVKPSPFTFGGLDMERFLQGSSEVIHLSAIADERMASEAADDSQSSWTKDGGISEEDVLEPYPVWIDGMCAVEDCSKLLNTEEPQFWGHQHQLERWCASCYYTKPSDDCLFAVQPTV